MDQPASVRHREFAGAIDVRQCRPARCLRNTTFGGQLRGNGTITRIRQRLTLFVARYGDAQLSEAAHQQVLASVRKHPTTHVRDLFERFLPEEQRVRRLGQVIKPGEILALTGDGARGRHVFFNGSGIQCRNCHRIDRDGQEVGPDLSQIGKKYNRSQLLECILEPSKTIDPAYVSYLVETSRGGVHTGLLVKKTDTDVVLKDGQGKLVTIPAKEVELLSPQQKSLMPELLLRDMTAQEVADLLEFLGALK